MNNNRQLIYTLITIIHSEVKKNQKKQAKQKRTFTYIVYGGHRKSITMEESFTEYRRFQIILLLFELLKKAFFGIRGTQSHQAKSLFYAE